MLDISLPDKAGKPLIKEVVELCHCEIIKDHDTLNKEISAYEDIPVTKKITPAIIQANYLRIKKDILEMVQGEMDGLMNHPALSHLVIKK